MDGRYSIDDHFHSDDVAEVTGYMADCLREIRDDPNLSEDYLLGSARYWMERLARQIRNRPPRRRGASDR